MSKERISIPEIIDLMVKDKNITKKTADEFIRILISTLEDALLSGDSVKIKGFGTFKPQWNEARRSVDVNTGNEIIIPGYYRVIFVPENELRDLINEPYSHLETILLSDDEDVENKQVDDQNQSSKEDNSTIEKSETNLTFFSTQAAEIKEILSDINALSAKVTADESDDENVDDDDFISDDEDFQGVVENDDDPESVDSEVENEEFSDEEIVKNISEKADILQTKSDELGETQEQTDERNEKINQEFEPQIPSEQNDEAMKKSSQKKEKKDLQVKNISENDAERLLSSHDDNDFDIVRGVAILLERERNAGIKQEDEGIQEDADQVVSDEMEIDSGEPKDDILEEVVSDKSEIDAEQPIAMDEEILKESAEADINEESSETVESHEITTTSEREESDEKTPEIEEVTETIAQDEPVNADDISAEIEDEKIEEQPILSEEEQPVLDEEESVFEEQPSVDEDIESPLTVSETKDIPVDSESEFAYLENEVGFVAESNETDILRIDDSEYIGVIEGSTEPDENALNKNEIEPDEEPDGKRRKITGLWIAVISLAAVAVGFYFLHPIVGNIMREKKNQERLEYIADSIANLKKVQFIKDSIITNQANDSSLPASRDSINSANASSLTDSVAKAPAQKPTATKTETTSNNTNIYAAPRSYRETLATEKMVIGSQLTKFAKKYYGHPNFWVYIFEANRDKISDPNNVPTGIDIKIPKMNPKLIDPLNKESMNYALKLQSEYLR